MYNKSPLPLPFLWLAQHASADLHIHLHLLRYGFIKSFFPLIFVHVFLVSCISPEIKDQVLYSLSVGPLYLTTICRIAGRKQRKKSALLSDQIFQAGLEVGKWLSNTWFVHCFKATEILQYSSISNFFSLISLSREGIHLWMPKCKVNVVQWNDYGNWHWGSFIPVWP